MRLYFRGQKTAPFRVRMNYGRSSIPLQKPWALARGASYQKIGLIVLACFMLGSQIAFTQGTGDLKSEIYSKLDCCPCKEPFEKCTCPEAKAMKAYIEALIDAGLGRDEIFYKVAKKFTPKVIIDEKIKASVEKRLVTEMGDNRPQAVSDITSYDFGKINRSKQGKISKVFKLSNKGRAPLIINNAKTFCPCALISVGSGKNKSPYFKTQGAPEGWQMEIKPGKAIDIELVVDLMDQHANMGKLARTASVYTNDSLNPEIKLKVEADVLE